MALGALLASIQILPFLEYLGLSRGAQLRGGHALNPYHAPASTLIAALVPNFWGHHSAGNFAGPTNYLEQTSYPGVVVWLLAVVGLAASRRQPRVWFFAAAALLALLTFYGAPGVLHLVSSVPLLASASLPRVAVVAAAALVVLAAHGAEAAIDRAGASTRLLTIGTLAATAAAAGAMLLALRTAAPDLDRHGLLAWSATWIGWASLLLAATALTVIGGAARLAIQGAIVAVLLALIVCDQMAFGRNFREMTPRDQVFPRTPEIDRIRQDRGLVRTIGVATHLFPNSAMVYRLQDLRSYDGLGVSHYADLLDVALPCVPSHQFHEADRLRGGPLLDLLNVKYVIAPGTVDPPPNFVAVTAGGATVFENRSVMPRAFLVDAAVVLEGKCRPPHAARRARRPAPDRRARHRAQAGRTTGARGRSRCRRRRSRRALRGRARGDCHRGAGGPPAGADRHRLSRLACVRRWARSARAARQLRLPRRRRAGGNASRRVRLCASLGAARRAAVRNRAGHRAGDRCGSRPAALSAARNVHTVSAASLEV